MAKSLLGEVEGGEIRESLQKAVLESYRDEYKELSEAWRNLESKAQGSVAIAGIFIGGAFAYIREIGSEAGRLEKVFLGASIICLIISVTFAVLALTVRKVAAPPIGEYVDGLVQDLLRLENDDDLVHRLPRFTGDQIDSWREVTTDAKQRTRSKANCLSGSHVFLVLAILAIALLSISKL